MSDIITYPEDGITYNADDAAGYLSTRSSGVYDVTEDYAVTPAGQTTVQISAGKAWIKPTRWLGRSAIMQQAATLALSAADANLPRIDRVVLRYDSLARKTSLVELTGTPASNPAAPALTRTAQIYDLCLAQITRPAGSTTITAANITDTRADEALCGCMMAGMIPVDGTLMQSGQAADAKVTGDSIRIEAARAQQAVSANTQYINAEVQRAQQAEEKLETAIGGETQRAQQMEQALSQQIVNVQFPYRIVYDHSYNGTGSQGTASSPVRIPLAGDYDAVGIIRTETSTYTADSESPKRRVLLELVTQESEDVSFKQNYITLAGLPTSFTAANTVNAGLIVIGGLWGRSNIRLRYANRLLDLYYEPSYTGDAAQPKYVWNESGWQYHVFGITWNGGTLHG